MMESSLLKDTLGNPLGFVYWVVQIFHTGSLFLFHQRLREDYLAKFYNPAPWPIVEFQHLLLLKVGPPYGLIDCHRILLDRYDFPVDILPSFSSETNASKFRHTAETLRKLEATHLVSKILPILKISLLSCSA
jgi:hypothetical protein